MSVTDTNSNSVAISPPGIVSSLASIIPEGSTLVLAIAKRTDSDTMIVTVQPPETKNDKPGTSLAFQVIGTADELDTGLAAALTTFVPARLIAMKTVDAISEEMQANAAAAKAAATAARTKPASSPSTTVTPKTAALTVSLNPIIETASIVATDSKGKFHKIDADVAVPMPLGKVSIKISADGYKTIDKEVALHADFRLAVDMVTETQGSLFA